MLGLKKQDPEKNKGKKKKRMFGSGEPRAECEQGDYKKFLRNVLN
jgi:hypothetical protein